MFRIPLSRSLWLASAAVKEVAVWRISDEPRSPPDEEFPACAMSCPEYAAFNEPPAADIRVFNKGGRS
jgi:hypothetical protein